MGKRFKKFELQEIFETVSYRNGLQVPTGSFVDAAELKEGKTPRISVTSENNGIIGYYEDIDSKNYRVYENCISMSFLGTVFYHPYRASFDMKVHCLKPINHELRRGEALYLVTCLQKLVKNNSYGNQTSSTDIPHMCVELPVDDNDCLDWDYMQDYMTKIEQKAIHQLEEYLIVSGLNDYTLTDEDKKIMEIKKEMKTFKIGDLFDIFKGKRLTKKQQTKGNTVFIGATDKNNGITGYIGQNPIFEGNAITVSYNGSVGQVFYQEKPFWASDDINVLYLKHRVLNRELFGYLGTILSKAGEKFSYSYKWNVGRMKETDIPLPVQTDEAGVPVIDSNRTYHPEGYIPDWAYMERYILAIEKTLIADVVKFKDKIFNTNQQ